MRTWLTKVHWQQGHEENAQPVRHLQLSMQKLSSSAFKHNKFSDRHVATKCINVSYAVSQKTHNKGTAALQQQTHTT